MGLSSYIAGFLSLYLLATPCLAFQHHGVLEDTATEGQHQSQSHSESHSHGENSPEAEEGEHCCSDLSSINHAPIKELPSVSAFVAVVPEIRIIIPDVHVANKIALARDGPIFEHAREFAKTVIIRV